MTAERIELGGRRKRLPLPRLLLLICVVVIVVGAYDRHYRDVIARYSSQATIQDETGTLSPERQDLLRDTARVMRKAYGVTLQIHVRPGPIQPPPPSPDLLFFGLDTSGRNAVAILPPLLDRALPPELAQSLASGYFDPYFAAGTWPEGLNSAVLAILEALRDKH